jgi:hypothetical protein
MFDDLGYLPFQAGGQLPLHLISTLYLVGDDIWEPSPILAK